jgi:hypothetical protein
MELVVLLFLCVVTAFVFYWVGLRPSLPHRPTQDPKDPHHRPANETGQSARRRRPF